MARISWIDADNAPALDAHVGQLEHFTASMQDGVIDSAELKKQEENLLAAMKAVEKDLSDEQHGKVTALLAELSAYNVMKTLHELMGPRVAKAVKGAGAQ